jgi:hypothetical protein
MRVLLFSLLLLVSLSGCGYRLGPGPLASRYATISVPYVEGDRDGDLTRELVRKLGSNGGFRYSPDCGELILRVKVVELKDKNIGFRYDVNDEGELKKSIIPVETRLTALSEVELIDSSNGEVLLGPAMISAFVEFDHEYYSSHHGVNVFSLGQLTDTYEAHDAAKHPLNIALSQKIVDFISNSW